MTNGHEDWPLPTAEDMELLRTIRDSEELEEKLHAVGGNGRIVEYTENRTVLLDRAVEKGVISQAGRALLAAADLARETLRGRPAFTRIGATMADGSIYVGISPDTFKPMYMTASDAPEKLNQYQAFKYAAALEAHGRHDWRLPTIEEGRILSRFFNTGASGKTFQEPEGHWLSTLDAAELGRGWLINDATGDASRVSRQSANLVRCIRCE